MSEAKFTKAPWVVFERFGNKQVDNDDLDLHICSFQGRGDDYDYDAHLIAAAPEMYNLLERLTSHDNCKKDIIHLLGEADNLLAKARGES